MDAPAPTTPAQEPPPLPQPEAAMVPGEIPPRPQVLAPPALGVSAGLAAALGWLLPGLGQIALGRVGAGLVLLATIGGLFVGGLALTDFTAVEPREHQLEFAAQALIGGPTALAVGLTQGVQLERMPPWLDVGRLFVVVSGLLNLIALCDALGEAARRNALARATHARLRAAMLAPAPTQPPPTQHAEPLPPPAPAAPAAPEASGLPWPAEAP